MNDSSLNLAFLAFLAWISTQRSGGRKKLELKNKRTVTLHANNTLKYREEEKKQSNKNKNPRIQAWVIVSWVRLLPCPSLEPFMIPWVLPRVILECIVSSIPWAKPNVSVPYTKQNQPKNSSNRGFKTQLNKLIWRHCTIEKKIVI